MRSGSTNLRKFGAKVHFLNKDPNKDKFATRGISGTFVGYPKNAKGYKVWVPERRKFMIDIRLDEVENVISKNQEPSLYDSEEDSDRKFIDIEYSTRNVSVHEKPRDDKIIGDNL